MTAWMRDDVRAAPLETRRIWARKQKQLENHHRTPLPPSLPPLPGFYEPHYLFDFLKMGGEETDRLSTSLLLQPAAISQLASARPSCPIGGACVFCPLYA